MELCNEDHDEVCFETGIRCPVCEADRTNEIDEVKRMRSDLIQIVEKIKGLVGTVSDPKNDEFTTPTTVATLKELVLRNDLERQLRDEAVKMAEQTGAMIAAMQRVLGDESPRTTGKRKTGEMIRAELRERVDELDELANELNDLDLG